MHGLDAQPALHTKAALGLAASLVDFASAFDPVDGDSLWQIMAADEIGKKFNSILIVTLYK